jgi:hypothetical protein
MDYSLTLTQKILSLFVIFLLTCLVSWIHPYTGVGSSTILLFIFMAPVMVMTFFVSAAWAYKATFQEKLLMIRSNRGEVKVPYEKVGMLVRSGSKLFPNLIVVLRAAEVGQPVSTAKLDPESSRMIEEYKSRMPNKEVTIVQVPGRYLRSIKGFAEELQKRVPPVKIDPRIG